jgi:hypothetical protein
LHLLKTADLTAVSDDNSYVKARYINSKTKKSFLIPIRGLLNLGIVQMGTTKVKALDPKAEVAKVNDYLRNQLMVRSSSNFLVVSVKDRIQESTGNYVPSVLLPSVL